MSGWRGSGGAQVTTQPGGQNRLRPAPHGYGGLFGVNLSAGLGTVNKETGEENLSNTATLPVRTQTMTPFQRILKSLPGAQPKGSGVPGTPAAGAYGNPGNVTASSGGGWPGIAKGGPSPDGLTGRQDGQVGAPFQGGEATGPRIQPFPHVSALGVGQESAWRGGLWFANDRLEAYDRYGLLNSGSERGGGRGSGQTDPPMDGPARPALKLVNRVINWQQGNPLATQDQWPGEQRDYNVVPPMKAGSNSAVVGGIYANKNHVTEPGPQFVGEQGTGWSPVYGGVPGLYQPYGSYAGYTANKVQGIQSPAPEGTPADGPQLVFSGLPHGLHSQTYPDYALTLGRYLAVPQMTQPRQDRPSNSTTAGQAFNQMVVPQGQTGTAAVQRQGVTQFSPTPATVAAWNRSQKGTAWRGIRPGGGAT